MSAALCFSSLSAEAASYRQGKWLLSGLLSYGVVEPEELNARLGDRAAVLGMIGFHIQGERTLRAPDITQWAEFSYSIGDSTADFSHFTAIPLGATYWFNRTAYIDFGAGLGLGMGLSPALTSGSTTLEGGLSFLAEARLTGRFWFSKFIGLTANAGLRIYGPTLEGGGESVEASLTSLTGTFGVTWAIGGTTGLGRSFVEVLPPEERGRAQPQPYPQGQPKAPAPATTAPPATQQPKAAPKSQASQPSKLEPVQLVKPKRPRR